MARPDLPPDTAICFTTFLREALCRRLVESIRRRYPRAAVFVANDGREPIDLPGATVYDLDFDLGVSAKRNFLADRVPSSYRYLVYVDDDMVFTDATRIEALRRRLDADPELALVSGRVYDFGTDLRRYEAVFRWEDGGRTLRLVPVEGERTCDLTQNFFLARRELFAAARWNGELKLAEHVPFFVSVKAAGWKCAHTPSVAIDHWPEVSHDYRHYRLRHSRYQKRWMDQEGLQRVVRPNGVEIDRRKLEDPGYWPWVAASRGQTEGSPAPGAAIPPPAACRPRQPADEVPRG